MINITDKKSCCGCSACVQACPKKSLTLVEDEMGFLYPTVTNNACVECGLCEKVCPVLNKWDIKSPLEIFACKNKNYEQRLASSSGGVFVLLAEQVIKQGGVVFGAKFDINWSVKHSYTENLSGLASFQGSKYVQSRMEDSYRQSKYFLEQGRMVLFSGTPCQISGLKHYLKNDYENLLTVEIVCHGVPSPRVWNDYLDWIRCEKGMSQIERISFRDKHDGWNGYSLYLCFSTGSQLNKEFRENHEDNLFMKGFLNNIYLRPVCFECPAKGNRSKADISLGDFWSINKHYAKFNDDKGTTLAYINSERGLTAFKSINCDSIHLINGIVYNKAYSESTGVKYPISRFVAEYEKKGFVAVIDAVKNIRQPFYQRLLNKAKKYAASFIYK